MSQVFFGAPEDFAVMPEEIGAENAAVVQTPPVAQTPAQALAAQNASRLGEVAAAADRAGGFVTGADQEEVDAILAGVGSGIYSADDALGRLSNIESAGRSSIGSTTTGTTTTTTTEDAVAARALAQQRTDAFSRLQGLLSRVGLGELEGVVKNIISSGTVDLNDGNAILFAIREQPAYQRRFAGNAARRARGLAELDPSTYVGLEDSYRQLMQSNGLPAGFYDAANDFQKLIEGDVSPQELQERIEQGYRKVQDADPEVKRQMRELYGLGDTELAAYFLDPDKAATLLTRQARAAQIAARGREQGGLDLTRESAEALAARGITPEEAQAQFAQRGALAGLYNPLAGEEALTQEEELGATFGFDPVARERLERRRAQRVAEFQGGGSFARTTGATSGTVETGIGTAS
jgi:hypothetical protein